MNTKGMIRSSWQRFRNSFCTNHHLQYHVLLAHGGCVPLGFCAVDHGRKLRIALNPLCNGSASTNPSSVQYGSSILSSLLHPQPRLSGRDDSFQVFIQEGTDTPLNCLPARVLRCFKVMTRRMHAHHREQDNHRFFVPYRIAVRNNLQPAGPNANITFRFVSHNGTVLGLPGYAHVPGLTTGTEVTLMALDPNKPTVVMACSEYHNWFTALAQRWHVQVVTI